MRKMLRQRIDVARRHEQRGLLVFEHVADLIELRSDDALAHGHVLEQLRRRSEKRRAVGVRHVRRHEHVARREITRAFLLRDETGEHRRLEGAALRQNPFHLAQPRTGANHQQPQARGELRIGRAKPNVRVCQGFGAVPRTERADEADDGRVVQAELRTHARAVDAGTVAIGIDAVWIHQHARRVDASPDDLVPHRLAHHDDKVCGAEVQALDAIGQRFVLERPAPMTAHPDLRAVVLDDKGHTHLPRDSHAGVVVQAVALIDERRQAAVERAIDRRFKRVVQDERRKLLEIPERFGRRDQVLFNARVDGRDLVGRDEDRRRREMFELVHHAGDMPDRAAGADAEAEIGTQVQRRLREIRLHVASHRDLALERLDCAGGLSQQHGLPERLRRQLNDPSRQRLTVDRPRPAAAVLDANVPARHPPQRQSKRQRPSDRFKTMDEHPRLVELRQHPDRFDAADPSEEIVEGGDRFPVLREGWGQSGPDDGQARTAIRNRQARP